MTCINKIIEQIINELAIASLYQEIQEALARFDYSGIDKIAQEFLN